MVFHRVVARFGVRREAASYRMQCLRAALLRALAQYRQLRRMALTGLTSSW